MLLVVVSFFLTSKLCWAVWRARQVRPWLDVMLCYIRRTEQSCCKWKDRLDVEVKKYMFWLWLIFFFCTKLFLIPVALITWTVILEYLAKKFKQKANLEPFFWRVEGCAIYTCAKILINKSSSFSELAILVAFWLLLYQGLNGLFIPLFYNLQVATADLNFNKSCATWSQVQALTRTNLSLLVWDNFEGLNKGKINWQVNGSSEQFPWLKNRETSRGREFQTCFPY